jgi:hypothetical protein
VDQLADPAPVPQVQQGGRLVEHHVLGLQHEHRRDREQLLLPAAEQVRGVVPELLQAVGREGLGDPPVDLVAGHAAVLEPERDVLGHGRHDDLHVRILEDETDQAADHLALLPGVEAVHAHPAFGGHEQAVEQARERALAGAVGADDRHAALVEPQVDLAQHPAVAEPVADPLDLDGHVTTLDRGSINGYARRTATAASEPITTLTASPGRNTTEPVIAWLNGMPAVTAIQGMPMAYSTSAPPTALHSSAAPRLYRFHSRSVSRPTTNAPTG